MRIRTLIVDDEPPARELIAELLRREMEVDLVGQCASGDEAVGAIEQLAPDLLFLDIQMPGLDGFGTLAAVAPERWPLLVFVTAYDQYAVRAFQVRALDYLLKPFEYHRVHQAVERARTLLGQGQAAAQQDRVLGLLEELNSRFDTWDRMVVRDAGRVTFIKPDEIDRIEAEGNYVRLHVRAKSHLLRETLQSVEARLGVKKFLRVNRSTLVNLERVKEWQPLFHGDSVLILEDGTRLTVSRVYREKLDQLVSRLE